MPWEVKIYTHTLITKMNSSKKDLGNKGKITWESRGLKVFRHLPTWSQVVLH